MQVCLCPPFLLIRMTKWQLKMGSKFFATLFTIRSFTAGLPYDRCIGTRSWSAAVRDIPQLPNVLMSDLMCIVPWQCVLQFFSQAKFMNYDDKIYGKIWHFCRLLQIDLYIILQIFKKGMPALKQNCQEIIMGLLQ